MVALHVFPYVLNSVEDVVDVVFTLNSYYGYVIHTSRSSILAEEKAYGPGYMY